MRVALATCGALAKVHADDTALVQALSELGHSADLLRWDGAYDWATFDACVLRSTWDYHERAPEFLAWVESVSRSTRLFNDAATVRWNAHKFYLRDLGARGLPVAPTAFLERGRPARLRELLGARKWGDAIIKPAVSAGAFETMRVQGDLGLGQVHLDKLLTRGDVLIQPYLRSIEDGERSHVFIDGTRTHSVKRPGGMGVPVEEQDVAEHIEPTREEAELAGAILRAAPTKAPLYARVDLLKDDAGALRLMELELIEPSLFLRHCPDGARPLAMALERLGLSALGPGCPF